jgi:outer membrane protein TolC
MTTAHSYRLVCRHGKIMLFTYGVNILLAASPSPAFARQAGGGTDTLRYTLDDVWNKLLLNNKKLTVSALTVEREKAGLQAAKDERLPDIGLNSEYQRLSRLPEYTNGIFNAPEYYPIAHEAYDLGGSAYFNIYSGGRLSLKIAGSQTRAQLSEEEHKQTRSELKVLAAAYYLDLERSMIFKKLIQEDILDQEKQLLKIKVLQKNGVVLKSDVLRADLKLSKQKFALLQIENDIAIIDQKLAVLIGSDDTARIKPIQSFTPDSLTLKAYNEYLDDAMANAFPVHIADKSTDLKNINVKSSKAAYLPSIGLFADYAYSYPQGIFYPYSASVYGLGGAGIKVTWQVSAFFKNRSTVKAATVALRAQQVLAQDVRDSVKTQVTDAYLRFKEALTGIEVARKNVVQANENFRVLTNSYFNQTALITDLLDADTQKLQAGFDLESSEMNAQLKYFQLQQTIGNL